MYVCIVLHCFAILYSCSVCSAAWRSASLCGERGREGHSFVYTIERKKQIIPSYIFTYYCGGDTHHISAFVFLKDKKYKNDEDIFIVCT
jgi:hypothetical protein